LTQPGVEPKIYCTQGKKANHYIWFLGVKVFNATFNNISVISWWSVLLVEEYPEITTSLPQVTDKLTKI
jgi:hypothetical protein